MEISHIIKVLETERECVLRQDTPKCDRRCESCDLLLPTEEVLGGYDGAINELSKSVNKNEDKE